MKRRAFLKVAGGAGLVKVSSSGGAGNLWSATSFNGAETSVNPTPAVVKAYSADQQRQRLQNIAMCERTPCKF